MRMHEKEASASRDVLRRRHNISQELELDFSKRAIKKRSTTCDRQSHRDSLIEVRQSHRG